MLFRFSLLMILRFYAIFADAMLRPLPMVIFIFADCFATAISIFAAAVSIISLLFFFSLMPPLMPLLFHRHLY